MPLHGAGSSGSWIVKITRQVIALLRAASTAVRRGRRNHVTRHTVGSHGRRLWLRGADWDRKSGDGNNRREQPDRNVFWHGFSFQKPTRLQVTDLECSPMGETGQ